MFSRVYVAALACLALATLSAAIVVPPGKCLDLSDPVATCETDVCSMQGTTCKKSCVQDRCSDCASKCACDTDADCDETEWCRNTLIPQHVGTCVRLAQEGEPCEGRRFGSYPNRCASGLVCTHASNMRRDMPGVCTAPAATAAVAAAVAAPAEADLCAFSEEAKKPCLSMIAIQRFYYNAAAGDCLAYTTCRLTNFGSYDECKQSCAAKSAAPAPVAAPEAALVAEVAAPQPTCAFDTSAKEPCLSAIVIKRWFYSSEAGDCVAYTTCRMTNFDSYEQCKASCAAADVPSTPTTPELCASAPDMSKPCLDEIVLKRWYFSSAAGKCVSYTTCRNEFFASETECSASCSSFAPAPIADVVAAPAMDKCAFDVAANQRCLSMIRMKRYYYSAEAGQCVAYVTCRATNFSSMQECNQSCAATTASA